MGSSDGGENWNPIKIWTNHAIAKYREETILISKDEVEFTNMARLRFRCDANDSNESFFIDEIEFDGLENVLISSNPTPVPSEMTSPTTPSLAPSVAHVGLRLVFDENGVPVSIKNSYGKEYVRQKKPFSKGFFTKKKKKKKKKKS